MRHLKTEVVFLEDWPTGNLMGRIVPIEESVRVKEAVSILMRKQ